MPSNIHIGGMQRMFCSVMAYCDLKYAKKKSFKDRPPIISMASSDAKEEQYDAKVHRTLLDTLGSIIAPLTSSAPNAKYGPADLVNIGIALCKHNTFVAPTVRTMKRNDIATMTRQRFLQILGQQDPDMMLECCLDMLEAGVMRLKETGRLDKPITMAMDEHGIEYYGKNRSYTKGGRRKNGTNQFEGYITAQAVSGQYRATLAAYPIATGESQSHYVAGLLENTTRQNIQIKTVLVDRGFFSADVISTIESYTKYIIPVPGNQKLYDMMQEYHDGTGEAIRPYTIKNKDGKSITGTLVICTRKKPRKHKRSRRKKSDGKSSKSRMSDLYVAFLTNIEVKNPKKLLKYIPKTYRIRWGIETGYRVLESSRAKTKSPKIAARLFLLFFSLVFVNFWLMFKRDNPDFPKDPMPLFDYADVLWKYLTSMSKAPT